MLKHSELLLAASVPLLWGIGFTFAKAGLNEFPPLFLMGLALHSGSTDTGLVCANSPRSADTDILDFLRRIHTAVWHDVHGAFHA